MREVEAGSGGKHVASTCFVEKYDCQSIYNSVATDSISTIFIESQLINSLSRTIFALLTQQCKSCPCTGLAKPLGLQEVEAPRILDNRHMRIVRLSALRTGRHCPQGRSLALISVTG